MEKERIPHYCPQCGGTNIAKIKDAMIGADWWCCKDCGAQQPLD